jgi:hypothetical protein
MATAHLIIDGKPEFNAMESYYKTFPRERTKANYTYDLTAPVRMKQVTFAKLLDKMIDLRKSSGTDNFVIVCHGLHDAKDFGWGLAMPMVDNTAMKASYEVMKDLLDLRNKKASPSELEQFEANYEYTNASLGLFNVKFPKGSVVSLVDKMRQLQQLKVRIVELRACTLGTNVPGMEIVGQSFGARFIVAPDVHMFYVEVDARRGFNPDNKVYNMLTTRLPTARKFENPTNSSEKLMISLTKGFGFNYTTSALCNTANMKWFTDKYLWANGRYANGSPKPANFFVEGMDLGAGRYALPQDQGFYDHLISSNVLAGNLI